MHTNAACGALAGASDALWCEGAKRFNAVLSSRGLEPMALRDAPAGSRTARTVHALFDEAGTLQRREMFRRFVPATTPEKSAAPGADDTDVAAPLATPLAQIQAANADHDGALFAVVPQIDPALCSGCDACVRICPPEALGLIDEDGGAALYHVHPESCDACGLCETVCEAAAISLKAMAPAPEPIPLQRWACRACGVAVHAPEAAAQSLARDGLCTICTRTGHHKKLYQVLS